MMIVVNLPSYSIQETGLFFKGNIWLKPEVKEELPHWIMNEKMLRNLIEFVSPSLTRRLDLNGSFFHPDRHLKLYNLLLSILTLAHFAFKKEQSGFE